MPKDFSRKDRVAEQIRRELAELIRLEVKDPRVGMVSLTDVEVSPDYAHAKVYFSHLEGEKAVPAVLAGLTRAAGFLRRELGKRIRLHTLPELHFHYDRSIVEGDRLSRLIDDAIQSDEHFKDGEPQ